MKKFILTPAFILLIMKIGLAQTVDYSKYDNEDGTSMMPIYKLTESYIESFEKENFEIVRLEFDLIFKEKKSTYRYLYEGNTYVIFAFGDYRVKDMDLHVSIYDSDKEEFILIDKDKAEKSYAMVSVKPTKTGYYKFEPMVYDFEDNYSAAHYSLMVIHN